MPFITEELWQNLAERSEGESIMNAQQRPAAPADEAFLQRFASAQEIITTVRSLRTSKNLSPREALVLEAAPSFPTELDEVLVKMAGLSTIDRSGVRSEGAVSFVIGTDEFAVPMAAYIDVEEELKCRPRIPAEVPRWCSEEAEQRELRQQGTRGCHRPGA